MVFVIGLVLGGVDLLTEGGVLLLELRHSRAQGLDVALSVGQHQDDRGVVVHATFTTPPSFQRMPLPAAGAVVGRPGIR